MMDDVAWRTILQSLIFLVCCDAWCLELCNLRLPSSIRYPACGVALVKSRMQLAMSNEVNDRTTEL